MKLSYSFSAICPGGCGVGGKCMRPGLCLCMNKEIAPFCRKPASSGNHISV